MDMHLLTFGVCCLIACVTASKRRAISPHGAATYYPDESSTSNSTGGGIVKVCPPGQLPQKNNTVCCLPTACEPGYQLVTCTEDGRKDECKECSIGYRQPDYTASNDTTKARCFPYNKTKHSKCPRGDTKLSPVPYSDPCPSWCACDTDRCYYGDPCICERLYPACGVNEEMDPATNSCRPCPKYTYKNVEGCERCKYNVTLWRLGLEDTAPSVQKSQTTPQSTSTVTEKTSAAVKDENANLKEEVEVNIPPNSQHDAGGKSSVSYPLVIVSVVLGIAFVVLACALIVVWRRGSSSSSPRSGRLRTVFTKLVLSCSPNKQKAKSTLVSTTTTPVSDETSLLDDPDSPTTDIELVDKQNSEDTALKLPNGKPTDESSLKTIYNRVDPVKEDGRRESARNVRRENDSFMRQNSVTVGAEVHSSSSSSVSSDHDEIIEDGATHTKPAIMQNGTAWARNKMYTANPGSVTAPKRNPEKAGSLFGAGVETRMTDKWIPVQGPSLNQGRSSSHEMAPGDKGRILVRGQLISESDEDTGICMEGSDPQMMKLCSVSLRGDAMDDITSHHSTDQSSYELDLSQFATDTRQQTLGERDAPIGQSHSLVRPATESTQSLSLKIPSAVPSIDRGDNASNDRGDNPISPSQTTQSPRIVLPASPGEFQGRRVATIQPLSRVNEVEVYHHSGPSFPSSANMEGSSLSVASYFHGVGGGSLDIANQGDFSSSDFVANQQNNSQQYPANLPASPMQRRVEPDGASGQQSPRSGSAERDGQDQTRLKQVVPWVDGTQETIPKCVANTDGTTRKTAAATAIATHNNDNDKSKMQGDAVGIGNDRNGDIEGDIGITKDPYSDTDAQTKALSPVTGAANSDLVMEELKECELGTQASETQTRETQVSDNANIFRDDDDSSVELPNPAVDVSEESFELPNDWEGMENERTEGDGS